jgi:hypothetical protein
VTTKISDMEDEVDLIRIPNRLITITVMDMMVMTCQAVFPTASHLDSDS